MNNPKAAEIEADNTARQEWNRTADMAFISGISEAKILEVKQTEIHEKASQGIYIYIKSRKRSIQRRKSLKLIKSLWKRCTLSIRECKYEYRNKTVIFNSGLV